MDERSLKLMLAQGVSVEEIGRRFRRDPSTVAYWMRKYDLKSLNREKYAAKGGVERERLEALVARGLSIAEIAAEVGLSKGTVRHWLQKFGLRTVNRAPRRSTPQAIEAREAGLLSARLRCPTHGETEFSMEGRGYYRCRACRSAAVTGHRRRVKAMLVAEAGGRCILCGYERCQAALAFHHLDPATKVMPVSAEGNGVSLKRLRREARKCVLLCHNCHAEVEIGAAALPVQFAAQP